MSHLVKGHVDACGGDVLEGERDAVERCGRCGLRQVTPSWSLHHAQSKKSDRGMALCIVTGSCSLLPRC